ncbi:thioredoxin family protein [Haloferula sp. BvORR071]|uniref:thioredoxin family protein n=1 Tax=Haloferula sp. BvORR071 TaxID=1396141 RepID=UPI000555C3D5|nr:thioredoxin family protein [Haloferula sp. BvORR071]
MKPSHRLIYLTAALALGSCAGSKKEDSAAANNGFGPSGIPMHLRGGGMEGGTPIAPGGNQQDKAAAEMLAKLNYTDADLAWTDPDNADADIPKLSQVMAGATSGTNWGEDEPRALRMARREGKPLMVWFTDSKNSAACKTLSDQLLNKPEFESWAKENTIRLVVDLNPTSGKDIDTNKRLQLNNRELKKKYNARGFPTIMVIAGSGEVIGRYTGYRRGKEDFLWGQMKQGVSIAQEKQKTWRASLEKKGYREWSDHQGRTIFAKLASYNDGNLILAEPDGHRAQTGERYLSSEDQTWIKEQKAARGIQ